MSELLPCPECGREPRVKRWSRDDGDVSIFCCGVTVDNGSKQWNRYVAAIKLALAAAWSDECESQKDYMDDITSNRDAWRSIVNLDLDANDKACDAFQLVVEAMA